jgi:hypothetical protein
MRNDLKESVLIIAGGNTQEYDNIMKGSVDDFLVRYKLFIEETERKWQQQQRKY